MDPKSFEGIYVVSAKEEKKTTFVKFYDIVRNEANPHTMIIQGANLPDTDVDGAPMDTNPGALVLISKVNTMKGVAFNIANVAPSMSESHLQYEYVLWKLGLGIEPKGSVSMEILESQFKVHLSKKVEDQ